MTAGAVESFAEKVVIVTGAGSGIGRALCKAFAAEGAYVIAADLNHAAAEETLSMLLGSSKSIAAHLDVGDAASWATLASQVESGFGRCDILCNNAGITLFGGFRDTDPLADWEAQNRVNVLGPLLGCRTFLPGMLERGSGIILNTSSGAGLAPWPEAPMYTASKHAVVGLSTSLAAELEGTGVSISVLCPGAVDTPMNEGFEPEEGERRIPPEEVADRVLQGIGEGRFWIFTHAELLPFFEMIHGQVVADHEPLEEHVDSDSESVVGATGIHHTGISTPDIDRLVDFYCEMFGFREVERLAWDGRPDVDALQGLSGSKGVTVMLRLGDTRLELFQFHHPDPEWSPVERPVSRVGLNHVCLAVDDVEEAYRRLVEAGMRFHSPPADLGDGRPLAYGRDPDGNVVEIWQVGMTEV